MRRSVDSSVRDREASHRHGFCIQTSELSVKICNNLALEMCHQAGVNLAAKPGEPATEISAWQRSVEEGI